MEPIISSLAGIKSTPGDLVFFHRLPSESANEFESAVVFSSRLDSSVYHVAVVMSDGWVVHAVCDGVREESLAQALLSLQPDIVELGRVELGAEWKTRACEWARGQIGSAYNDLFSPECIDSTGRRAFYCCQLAAESYKSTNPTDPGESPFLPHKLNFLDSQTGEIIPYWVDYYREKCPQSPDVPQDRPGSHPSILRASPCVRMVASRLCNMKRFAVPGDLVDALHFINGARVSLKASGASHKFDVIEPRNGETLAQCEAAIEWQVEEVARVAQKAQQHWALTPWMERRGVLKRTAGEMV